MPFCDTFSVIVGGEAPDVRTRASVPTGKVAAGKGFITSQQVERTHTRRPRAARPGTAVPIVDVPAITGSITSRATPGFAIDACEAASNRDDAVGGSPYN